MSEEFIFSIARIRSKEKDLLSQTDLAQLMSCCTVDECIKILIDKGYGNGTESIADELVDNELNKLWSFMRELVEDISEFSIMLYVYDFHNLKVAIKSVITDTKPDKFFIHRGTILTEQIYKCIKNGKFSELPSYMSSVAEEAFNVLLKTHDGQLCDIILDNECLKQILNISKNSNEQLIQYYGEFIVAVANIKTAIRCANMNKSADFMKKAIVECLTIDKNKLIQSACKSIEDVYNYLLVTDYAKAVDALKQSFSAFEKWCDDTLMVKIKQEKYNPFTFGAIFAYALAKETEIKAIRIILSGKQNALDDNAVKERLRDMYV